MIVLILGVAIGLCTAFYSITESALLNPLPGVNLEGVVFLGGLSHPRSIDPVLWWGQSRTVQPVAFYSLHSAEVAPGPEERVPVTVVSDNFFDVFGVNAVRGSRFTNNTSGENTAVISYFLAQKSV
ncbi:MAG: hypothetical protein IT167_28295 [Bryobacterales bacterium]|nr:hypothetical protein [Bryobacterales bacterium]